MQTLDKDLAFHAVPYQLFSTHGSNFLASELKCLIYNPSMEVVKKTLPKKFKKPGYCKVRQIIDCTEIFIEIPSDPVIRASMWSDYKHHNTAKILV